MNPTLNIAKEINEIDFLFDYSICTVVSKKDQYAKMLDSFINAGFTKEKCEYLFVDNSEKNNYDAYKAFNIFLQKAQGKYIIICHQDIELIFDTKTDLEKRIEEVEKLDPSWALLGNAGGINLKYRAIMITHGDPPYLNKCGNTFPQKVQSLDENFILIKNEANLAVSADLGGFHFYGTDICTIAILLGYNSYVINFHLYHNSKGNFDPNYFLLKKSLRKKYNKAFRGRYIRTATKANFYISGNKISNIFYNTFFAKIIARQFFKIKLFFTGKY